MMKDAWKDDERLMNEERKESQVERENLLIDIKNVRAQMTHKLEVKVSELYTQMEAKSAVIRDLKSTAGNTAMAQDFKKLSELYNRESKEWKAEKFQYVSEVGALTADVNQIVSEKTELSTELNIHKLNADNKNSEIVELESRLAEFKQKVEDVRLSNQRLQQEVAERDDQIEQLRHKPEAEANRKSFDPLGNDSIDFENFPAPKLRSSMLPSFKADTTQELLSGHGIVTDMSKTPDLSRTPDFLQVPCKFCLYQILADFILSLILKIKWAPVRFLMNILS